MHENMKISFKFGLHSAFFKFRGAFRSLKNLPLGLVMILIMLLNVKYVHAAVCRRWLKLVFQLFGAKDTYYPVHHTLC